jgi:hypothetical protein
VADVFEAEDTLCPIEGAEMEGIDCCELPFESWLPSFIIASVGSADRRLDAAEVGALAAERVDEAEGGARSRELRPFVVSPERELNELNGEDVCE